MDRINKKIVTAISTIILIAIVSTPATANQQDVISLAGQWGFNLDNKAVGEKENWFDADLTQSITLPGSTAENGFGDDISVDTEWTGTVVDKSWYTEEKYEKYRQPGSIKLPFWLTPLKHYVGPAWYQKIIEIPNNWRDKRIVLFLERAHWETKVWIDGKEKGSQNSLAAPHQYDLGSLAPGNHRLAIRIDNTVKIDIGIDSHSISDQTQTNWNGIIGKIELRATDPVWIEEVQVYPNVQNKTAKVHITIANNTTKTADGTLTLQAKTSHSERQHRPAPETIDFTASKPQTKIEIEYPMTDDLLLWDEFSPNVYQMTATITTAEYSDTKAVDFGMRQFAASGTQFTINGRKTFLRGTLECCIFPLTGYPDMTVTGWLRIFRIAKSHGLNHMRFHSWCPPEAAFTAADQMGFMLHVECGSWGHSLGDGKSVDRFIYDESDRILKTYGNHPSFCLLAYGNEPGGENHIKYLTSLVKHWQAKEDPRRLYTTAAGWATISQNQYQVIPGPRCQYWQANLTGRLNANPPETVTDYRDFVTKYSVPIVSHEIGQWCVYPNFDEIKKYTGVTRAYNFEIFRDDLKENHMLDQAKDFLRASGKFQAHLYKEEIESALRTPGFGGFQLLDLHDFSGQGTALIGVLDAFWDEKGYIKPQQYRRFCSQTVPLARMEKRVWTSDETFNANVEISHFGPAPIEKAITLWSITDAKGCKIASGQLPAKTIPLGNATPLGEIELPLSNITNAQKLLLAVSIKGTDFSNDWDFWLYPDDIDITIPKDILIADKLNRKVRKKLKKGGKVMLIPAPDTVSPDKYGKVPPGFTTIFWNTQFTARQEPHTLGILCNPEHPALAEFPTEFHSNWQWWYLVTKSQIMILNNLPIELRPIVQVIDDWNTNRKLGLIFEAKVAKGKLLVCSIDLQGNLDKCPVARQMLHSLLAYMQSDYFDPKLQSEITEIEKLLTTQPNH
ncbi:MAG: hypothetical protein JSV82_00065 [Planctomycetota bacterium]|nr:MAG: hypothetical protein JSV82_00065 [Planctomycetota bacterium]